MVNFDFCVGAGSCDWCFPVNIDDYSLLISDIQRYSEFLFYLCSLHTNIMWQMVNFLMSQSFVKLLLLNYERPFHREERINHFSVAPCLSFHGVCSVSGLINLWAGGCGWQKSEDWCWEMSDSALTAPPSGGRSHIFCLCHMIRHVGFSKLKSTFRSVTLTATFTQNPLEYSS